MGPAKVGPHLEKDMNVQNPKLKLFQEIRLKDGRTGTIADQADHRKSRLVSVDNVPEIQKVANEEIVAAKIGGVWFDCTWS
jgi:hypothetical protein